MKAVLIVMGAVILSGVEAFAGGAHSLAAGLAIAESDSTVCQSTSHYLTTDLATVADPGRGAPGRRGEGNR